jgi:hypothetical protein
VHSTAHGKTFKTDRSGRLKNKAGAQSFCSRRPPISRWSEQITRSIEATARDPLSWV